MPGTNVVTLLDFVIARSAVVTIVSMSVAELLIADVSGAEAGAVTVAVLLSVSVAELITVA